MVWIGKHANEGEGALWQDAQRGTAHDSAARVGESRCAASCVLDAGSRPGLATPPPSGSLTLTRWALRAMRLTRPVSTSPDPIPQKWLPRLASHWTVASSARCRSAVPSARRGLHPRWSAAAPWCCRSQAPAAAQWVSPQWLPGTFRCRLHEGAVRGDADRQRHHLFGAGGASGPPWPRHARWSPEMTTWPGQLSLATWATPPAAVVAAQTAATFSSSRPRMAAIMPGAGRRLLSSGGRARAPGATHPLGEAAGGDQGGVLAQAVAGREDLRAVAGPRGGAAAASSARMWRRWPPAGLAGR